MRIRSSKQLLLASLLLICQQCIASAQTPEGRLAPDTPWATPYYIIDTDQPGPTVLVVGGTHGNEPAGARAAAQVMHWPIVKGRLIVVPRANVRGLNANSRYVPGADRANRDLNRNFPGPNVKSGEPRGVLAWSMWRLVQKHKPDWVLDLHEGYEFNKSHKPPAGKKKSVGSSVIYKRGPTTDPLAKAMQSAVNATVTDDDRKFTLLSQGPIATGLTNACIHHLGSQAMTLETTFKDQPLSLRTRQHRVMVNVVLRHIGMIDRDCVNVVDAMERDDKTIVVGLYDGGGTGAGGVRTLTDMLDKADGYRVHHLGPADIKSAVLKQCDIVLFPGGSGSKQAAAIGPKSRNAVRDYVNAGGGYIGICAGAYLCSAHYSWSLNLVDTKVFNKTFDIPGVGKKSMWYRGKTTTIKMELTPAGKAMFGDIPLKFDVRYHNGPIVSPKGNPDLPTYQPLAYFRSEQVKYEPQRGTMVNTPAIVASRFGKGRVIAISPHPESTPALQPIVLNAIKWVAGQVATAQRAGTRD